MRAIQYQEATARRVGSRSQSGNRRAAHGKRATGTTSATGIGAAERVELCMVKGVECFRTEFEGVSFFEFEALA
jgi:hypothetical protein